MAAMYRLLVESEKSDRGAMHKAALDSLFGPAL